MAEENYINIYSTYLAGLIEQKRIGLKEAHFLITAFIPVCESVHSRQQLIEFIEKHEQKYWELKELKKKLMDKNFIFKLPDE